MRPPPSYVPSPHGGMLAFVVHGSGSRPPILSLRPPQFSHVVNEWEAGSSHHEFADYQGDRAVIRFDPRGVGMSERDCRDFSLDGAVDDLEAVLAATGTGRVVLDGISSGALPALEFCRRHPKRVERLVVQNAFLDGARWWQNPVRRAMVNVAEVDWELCSETWAWLTWGDERRDRTLKLAKYIRDCVEPEVFLRMVAAEREVNLNGKLQNLRVPTLVLNHPRFARMAPEEHNAEVALAIPGAVIHTIHSTKDRVAAISAFAAGAPLPAASLYAARIAPAGQGGVLSVREVEVLRMVAEGLANRDIAERLVLSVRTVDAHVRSIFAKTNTTSRAGAAAFGIRQQIL